MITCKNCFSESIYCLDCHDSANTCDIKDHKFKCMNCRKITVNENPQKPKITLCQECGQKEGMIKLIRNKKEIRVCDVCSIGILQEKNVSLP